MKCIVKGCENEAFKEHLCEAHYDPDAPAVGHSAVSDKGRVDKGTIGRQMAMFGHGALLIAGKLAGMLVSKYNRIFTLSKEERARILDQIGASELRKGRKTHSLSVFEKVVDLDPNNPESHYRLGKACLAAEQFEKACENFHRVLELDNDFAPAYEGLGETYYSREDFKSALKYLKKAKGLAPNNEKVVYLIGLANDKLGSFGEAIKFLQQAIDMSPRNAKYYYSLGFAYDSRGEKDKALENFKRAMELEKTNVG